MQKRLGADCNNCPLRANQCVAETVPNARFIAITPAPTANDIFRGIRNSDNIKLFEKVLNFHGIPKSDFDYIPVVQCGGFKDLSTTEKTRAIKACSGYVIDTVRNSSAEACVSLGADAALTAVGSRAWQTYRPGPARLRAGILGVPVVPTASPQLCMVQQDKFPFLVTDIGKLVNKAPKFIEPRFMVFDEEQDAIAYMNRLLDLPQGIVTVDIETAMEKDLAFEHPERFEMLCVGLKYNEQPVVVLAPSALTTDVYTLMRLMFLKHDVLAHNGKFDLQGLRPHIGKVNLVNDTMLASYVFDERSGVHGLKYLSQEYLGSPDYDAEVKSYIGTSKNFANIPVHILYKYNAFDVYCTYELHKMYEERFANNPELQEAYNLLIEASNMLQDVEHSGMSVDEDYLDQLSDRFERDTEISRKNLVYQALTLSDGILFDKKLGFNPNSPKQIMEFYETVGIKINSSNEETLNKIIDFDGDAIPDVVKDFSKRILDHRSKIKLGKTYVQGTKERLYKGRIHPNYLLHGTTTGRLSCRNPNLQNIPRKSPIKRMFVASTEERVLVQSDYSQAELRTLCWLAGDSYFTPIFNEGIRDVFDELVPVLYPNVNKDDTEPDAWKEMRTMVKTYVYGLGYGRTEYGIARGFCIPVELAREHMKKFFEVIPEIVKWQSDIKEAVINGDDLITPFGRHRRYNLITAANKDNLMNEALAFLPQSTASDMTLTAAVEFNGSSSHLDARIVNLVHDAIMIDCPRENVEEVIDFVESCMLESAHSVVGDYVSFAVASSYGESWEDLK
ncbi:MAG TPA: DNA polymerase [Rectinema sp.]|nr:DNA polymerase [Rectinema sp.]